MPFRAIENQYFHKFVSMLSSSYNVPTRQNLSKVLLDSEFKQTVDSIQAELNAVESLSITLDCWTSSQNYPYLGVTVHFFNINLLYCNRTLTIKHLPGSHTGELLRDTLLVIFNEWNITKKIVAIVSDNASNVKKIAFLLNESLNQNTEKLTKIYQIGWAAHILNLIVQNVGKISNQTNVTRNSNSLSSQISFPDEEEECSDDFVTKLVLTEDEFNMLENYKNITEKCRKIAAVFHQSSVLADILREKQQALNLNQHQIVQDVPTRWNSTFLMLERIYEQYEAINEVFSEKSVKKNMKINDYEKLMVQDIIEVLHYYFDATLELSASKYVTISVVLPTFISLITHMEPQESDSMMVLVLKKILNHYTKFYMQKYNLIDNSILVTASYLDLRTKLFGRSTEKKRKEYFNLAKNTIKLFVSEFSEQLKADLNINKIQNFPCNSQTKSTTILNSPTTQEKRISRLQIYDYNKDLDTRKTILKLNAVDKEIYKYNLENSKNIEPIDFWQSIKESYPILFHIFKRIFSVPATSVPAEQLFSHAGYNVWDRRNRLNPSNVNKMMVVYENI